MLSSKMEDATDEPITITSDDEDVFSASEIKEESVSETDKASDQNQEVGVETKPSEVVPESATASFELDAVKQSTVNHVRDKVLIDVQTHPKFLHSNSTSHVWAFGAIAELIGAILNILRLKV